MLNRLTLVVHVVNIDSLKIRTVGLSKVKNFKIRKRSGLTCISSIEILIFDLSPRDISLPIRSRN